MTRPQSRTFDSAAYEQHEAAIAVIMNDVFLRHFIATYKAFDGDLVEAIVLGEIAHHNIAAMRTSGTSVSDLSRRLAGPAVSRVLLPTNAYSIAEACGIPRETVRRKVASLERRGWIARDAAGNLYVTTLPLAHFANMNRMRCAELIEAAREIEALLRPTSAGASARGSSPPGSRHPRARKRSATRA